MPAAPVIGGAGATLFQTGIEVGLLLAVMVVLQNVSWTFLLLPYLLVLLALAYRSWALTGEDEVQDDVEDRRIARLDDAEAARVRLPRPEDEL